MNTLEPPPLPGSFEALIHEAPLPVLVEFWAPWCGACESLSPVIQEVATHFKGKLLMVKINVDQKPEITTKHRIFAVPSLLLFHHGNLLKRWTGYVTYETLREEIEKVFYLENG